jgi:hypothetical protein
VVNLQPKPSRPRLGALTRSLSRALAPHHRLLRWYRSLDRWTRRVLALNALLTLLLIANFIAMHR